MACGTPNVHWLSSQGIECNKFAKHLVTKTHMSNKNHKGRGVTYVVRSRHVRTPARAYSYLVSQCQKGVLLPVENCESTPAAIWPTKKKQNLRTRGVPQTLLRKGPFPSKIDHSTPRKFRANAGTRRYKSSFINLGSPVSPSPFIRPLAANFPCNV